MVKYRRNRLQQLVKDNSGGHSRESTRWIHIANARPPQCSTIRTKKVKQALLNIVAGLFSSCKVVHLLLHPHHTHATKRFNSLIYLSPSCILEPSLRSVYRTDMLGQWLAFVCLNCGSCLKCHRISLGTTQYAITATRNEKNTPLMRLATIPILILHAASNNDCTIIWLRSFMLKLCLHLLYLFANAATINTFQFPIAWSQAR